MRFVYKFIGIGLLAFLALLIIPGSSATQSDDPSMYGMVTVHLKDESGKILFENQVHNEVVDQGTATMMNNAFDANHPEGDRGRINGLCVSNAASFSTDDGQTFATFNAANTIDTPFLPCRVISNFILTDTSASTGVHDFVAGTAFASNTVITGIGVCSFDPFDSLIDCNTDSIGTSAVLFGVVDIPNITVPSGAQLDVSYTVNLD